MCTVGHDGPPPVGWEWLVHLKGTSALVEWGKHGCYDHPDHG